MTSPWIESLRSAALNVPDLARAEHFYTAVWHLSVAARDDDTLYLRGSGSDHHLLSLHRSDRLAIRTVTLRARSSQALQDIAAAVPAAGGQVLHPISPSDSPAGGTRLVVRDPDGRLYEIVYGDIQHDDIHPHPDRPIRLAHAVLNCHHLPSAQQFLEQALGFSLSDRTKAMAFMNCNRDHHSLALGDTDNDALNHIAFLMEDVDAVMRGGGRMRDAGFEIAWGPGRHGPGNNAFNYFVGPFGEVIEYTAEVEQIDTHYVVGEPADWTWPPGRVDQWGLSAPPGETLKSAQRNVFFIPTE
jgi:catechol 2,3-dioxygenase-like lactoylglutathione lyase family enzyme